MASLGPLPDLDGPKLDPFPHDLSADDVEFLEILDVESAHGKIIKTKIQDRMYAVKFFGRKEDVFANIGEREYDSGRTSALPRETFNKYFIPFYNECRAYGRLKELDREHLAVKVHGYVSLEVTEVIERKMQHAMSDYFGPQSAARLLGGHFGDPVVAIVKDWVDMAEDDDDDGGGGGGDGSRFDLFAQASELPRMLERLHGLHECGIVVRDLASTQYVNGVLVDLSMACTMPHPFGPGGGWKPAWAFQSMAAWDLYCFQTLVIDRWSQVSQEFSRHRHRPRPKGARRACTLRAYEDPVRTDTLRPRPSRQRPFLPILNHQHMELQMTQLPRFDPGAFEAGAVAEAAGHRRPARRNKGGGGEASRKRSTVDKAPRDAGGKGGLSPQEGSKCGDKSDSPDSSGLAP
ncbi:hypothetical protein ACJ41O_008727 [Fusarium nematophilum]